MLKIFAIKDSTTGIPFNAVVDFPVSGPIDVSRLKIEFYDARNKRFQTEHGERVAGYYVSTLRGHNNGLALWTDIPEWHIDKPTMRTLLSEIEVWLTDIAGGRDFAILS